MRLVATGSEVAVAGAPRGPGQIVDTNTPFLQAQLARLLGEAPAAAAPVPDDEDALAAALTAALDGADLVVVTGGVSVGDRDLVRGILTERLGAEPLVWRVAVKPGKPVLVACREGTWVVGLPGNPAAVAVHWSLTLRPLVLALQGAADPAPRWVPVVLGADAMPERRRVWLRWCTLAADGGRLRADLLPGAESHMLGERPGPTPWWRCLRAVRRSSPAPPCRPCCWTDAPAGDEDGPGRRCGRVLVSVVQSAGYKPPCTVSTTWVLPYPVMR